MIVTEYERVEVANGQTLKKIIAVRHAKGFTLEQKAYDSKCAPMRLLGVDSVNIANTKAD